MTAVRRSWILLRRDDLKEAAVDRFGLRDGTELANACAAAVLGELDIRDIEPTDEPPLEVEAWLVGALEHRIKHFGLGLTLAEVPAVARQLRAAWGRR